MRVVLDANVLYPTLLRGILQGYAGAGGFVPLWSARILDEWRHAARRDGFEDHAVVEIAALTEAFPAAMVAHDADLEAGLALPDPDDIHVLAAAIAGQAEAILTANTRDFPTRTLARHAILRRAPDEFLREAWLTDRDRFAPALGAALDRARAHGIEGDDRALLKRARLPRLAKLQA